MRRSSSGVAASVQYPTIGGMVHASDLLVLAPISFLSIILVRLMQSSGIKPYSKKNTIGEITGQKNVDNLIQCRLEQSHIDSARKERKMRANRARPDPASCHIGLRTRCTDALAAIDKSRLSHDITNLTPLLPDLGAGATKSWSYLTLSKSVS